MYTLPYLPWVPSRNKLKMPTDLTSWFFRSLAAFASPAHFSALGVLPESPLRLDGIRVVFTACPSLKQVPALSPPPAHPLILLCILPQIIYCGRSCLFDFVWSLPARMQSALTRTRHILVRQ